MDISRPSPWLRWSVKVFSCSRVWRPAQHTLDHSGDETIFPVSHLTASKSQSFHISPILFSLHWLPVKQRVDYKLATLVYKSLRGQAPSYLVDDCQLIADSGRPSFAPLTPTSSLFREQTLDLATGVSRSRVRELKKQSTRLTAAARHWIWTLWKTFIEQFSLRAANTL